MLDVLKRSSSIPQNLVFPTSGENRDTKMLVQLQEFRRWSRENRSHQRWLVPCRLAQRDAQRKHPAESCLCEHSQRDHSRCLPRPPALPPQNSFLPRLCFIPLLVKKSFSHTRHAAFSLPRTLGAVRPTDFFPTREAYGVSSGESQTPKARRGTEWPLALVALLVDKGLISKRESVQSRGEA